MTDDPHDSWPVTLWNGVAYVAQRDSRYFGRLTRLDHNDRMPKRLIWYGRD